MTANDVSAFAAALVGTDDPEIVALEAEIRAAQLAADAGALDRLISDDLLFTGPDGRLTSKADDLAAHRSGLLRIREHDPLELRIRRVGADVAIVALRARIAAEVDGTPVDGVVRYTRIWAREAETWRVAGGHVAPVPGDPTSAGKGR